MAKLNIALDDGKGIVGPPRRAGHGDVTLLDVAAIDFGNSEIAEKGQDVVGE